MGFEMGSEYYDKVFEEEKRYREEISKLSSYPVYQVALGMIGDIEGPKILELGCGTGQFAKMLFDNGFTHYLGVDFSRVAIEKAREMSGQAFLVSDIRKFDDIGAFNTLVMMEVLEHIMDDIDLIKKYKGYNIIFSVPSCDDPAHVRFFQKREEVKSRYDEYIDIEKMVRYKSWLVVKGKING